MTTQPENTSWSGAVQRELDSVQRSVDSRFADLTNRLEKLLTLTEYNSDKRLSELQFRNLQEKIDDVESAIVELRREVIAERTRYENALAEEVRNRQTEHNTYIQQRQQYFRWTVSMVMIPIAIALVQLFLKK